MAKQGTVIEQPTLPTAEEPNGNVPATRPAQAVTTFDEADSSVTMFERLARDPNVDVEKIERLIAMQERMVANRAKSAFDEAFASMQGVMPVVIEKGRTDKTKYARLEDIQKTVRPTLQQFGFAISFQTEWPETGGVKVIGILTHKDGHQRTSEFMSVADKTGSKNDIQALGSAVSYGRRYTTLDLLNITTSEADDDGRRSAEKLPEPPAGLDDWLTDWQATADQGFEILNDAWKASNVKFTNYVNAHMQDKKREIIAKAKAVDKAKAAQS